MSRSRLFILSLFILLVAAAIYFDLHLLITLENFKTRQASADAWVSGNPLIAALTFFLIYVAVTAVNIPGAAVMTLIGGALFGVAQGTVIVSFASTFGATLAFLLSRYLLRGMVENRFEDILNRINTGLDKTVRSTFSH